MKNSIAITLIVILFMTLISFDLSANPFASKIKKVVIKKEDLTTIDLAFRGYAIMENQRFAVVQVDNRQHILKNGESLGRIKVIRFSANALYYQIGSRVYRAPIDSDKP